MRLKHGQATIRASPLTVKAMIIRAARCLAYNKAHAAPVEIDAAAWQPYPTLDHRPTFQETGQTWT